MLYIFLLELQPVSLAGRSLSLNLRFFSCVSSPVITHNDWILHDFIFSGAYNIVDAPAIYLLRSLAGFRLQNSKLYMLTPTKANR
jgi:hypothetical protein